MELGNVRDCEEVLRMAQYKLTQARDSVSRAATICMLECLRDHICNSVDPKSKMLLPRILTLLAKPDAVFGQVGANSFGAKEPPEGNKLQDTVETSESNEAHQLVRRREWLGGSVYSFLQQWPLLCADFMLVLSVLSFNVAISALLSRFHVEIKGYVEPILHVTDVCLVFLFCVEALALLVMTAAREIILKGRAFRRDDADRVIRERDVEVADPRLTIFRQLNVEQIGLLEDEMARGHFLKDAVEMPNAFVALGQSHSRFDAVSRDELPCWLADPTDPFAEEYFLLGMDLVRKGKKVTRIFLLSRNQLHQVGVLKEVLAKHLRAGIGFAVVPFDELPINLRKRAKELDFGLWDLGNAYSVFRQREGGYARKMEIVFSTPANSSETATKLTLYKEILAHAWLVDKVYADCQTDIISDVLPRLSGNTSHLVRRISGKVEPEANFFFMVNNETELNQKVENLCALCKLAHRSRSAETQELPNGYEAKMV